MKDLVNADRIILVYHKLDSLRSLVTLSNSKAHAGENNNIIFHNKSCEMIELDNSIDIKKTIKSISEKNKMGFYNDLNLLNKLLNNEIITFRDKI